MRRFVLLVLAAGCRQVLGLESPTHGASDAGIDAYIPDAGPCSAASAQCISDVLRTCSNPGAMPVDTTCSWGCVSGGNGAHCGELVPAGGGVLPGDLTPDTTLVDTTLSGVSLIINADTGAIGTLAQPTVIRPSGTGVMNGIDYAVRNGVAIFRFGSLTISGGVGPYGSHALALVADGAISVTGVLDMRAPCINQGSLGGSPGGNPGMAATGQGGGGGGSSGIGGSGGGYGGVGGRGGLNGVNSTGPAFGDAQITKLAGGGGGGGGSGGAGGAGGGAVQLVSNTSISIPGGINAGGCGGKTSSGTGNGGGGGGAGGTILLEAPAITINGKLAVNGGGGGGVGGSGVGADGTLDRNPAAGGVGSVLNGAVGAAGATTNGADGAISVPLGAGGGGGLGRIRLDTQSGSASITNGALLSPALTDNSTCTQAAAVVQ